MEKSKAFTVFVMKSKKRLVEACDVYPCSSLVACTAEALNLKHTANNSNDMETIDQHRENIVAAHKHCMAKEDYHRERVRQQ